MITNETLVAVAEMFAEESNNPRNVQNAREHRYALEDNLAYDRDATICFIQNMLKEANY